MPKLTPRSSLPKIAPKAHLPINGAGPQLQVSLKATESDEAAVVRTPLFKDSDTEDYQAKRGEKPKLKVEFAIRRIRETVAYYAQGYRQNLYEGYVDSCALAFRLRHNREEWQEFCNLSFWNQRPRGRPKPDSDEKALFYVLIAAMFGATRLQAQKASKVSIALQRFSCEECDAQDIVDFIRKSRGIQKLADEGQLDRTNERTVELVPKARNADYKKKVKFVGEQLDTMWNVNISTRVHIEAVVDEDKNGRRIVRCLSLETV